MTSTITLQRLEELSALVDSPSYVPGPLDAEDIKEALIELIGWRTGEPPASRVRTETVNGDAHG